MILGVALTLVIIFLVPKLMKSDTDPNDFVRASRTNPTQTSPEQLPEQTVTTSQNKPVVQQPAATNKAASDDDYAFYTLLPGEEVAISDEQLAAASRAEKERAAADAARLKALQAQQKQTSMPAPLNETTATVAVEPLPTPASTLPTPVSETIAAPTTATPAPQQVTSATPAPTAAAPATSSSNDTPYILQAGAFAASGDAESMKARIAMLGLNARVESANINGKTVYRVRMGPYGTATELATAKGKLDGSGLPAMAIKAK